VPDDESNDEQRDEVAERLARLEEKLDRLAQPPMTPGRAAAEVRDLMTKGYQEEARRRAEAAQGGEAA
jgi:hypothetical protein